MIASFASVGSLTKKDKLLFVIPAYNEEENIDKVLKEIKHESNIKNSEDGIATDVLLAYRLAFAVVFGDYHGCRIRGQHSGICAGVRTVGAHLLDFRASVCLGRRHSCGIVV